MAAAYLGILGPLALAYGALFTVLDMESAGSRVAGLRVVNFDGTAATARERTPRLLWKFAGIAGLGVGLLWALLDPRRLAWHDRFSETFAASIGGGAANAEPPESAEQTDREALPPVA